MVNFGEFLKTWSLTRHVNFKIGKNWWKIPTLKLKLPKMVNFGEFLKTCSLQSNSVTRQVNCTWKKLVENAKIENFKWRFEWTKILQKCQKWTILATFRKSKSCSQTVLPDKSILIGQKMVKMSKLKKSNATFLVIFKHCVAHFTHFETFCVIF